ncbi:MAG: hypothetical protein ACKOCA_04630 [Vulcanococcus sp.]|nr:hypothetical protein [Cyanobacteria bacterium M_DeepCast_200m_mx_001]
MATAFSNPRLLSFSDHGAPYRGHWVIYAAGQADSYAACHELCEQGQSLQVVEQRQLPNALEARRFSTHLILHGWTPDEVHSDQGYSLLGAGA